MSKPRPTFLPACAAILVLLAARASAHPPALEKMTPIDAWTAVGQMTPGINIGNTLENTAEWETGWGNPPITREYVQSLARLGFKTVRPVSYTHLTLPTSDLV